MLRDSNGTAVNGWFQPSCSGQGPYFLTGLCANDYGQAASDCVAILNLGPNFFGSARFDLATGEMGPCAEQYADWREASTVGYPPVVFADDACSGPGFATSDYYTNLVPIQVDGDLYYAPHIPANEITPLEIFYWDEYDFTCYPSINDQFTVLYEYVPVPAFVRNALPNAPYTLGVEY